MATGRNDLERYIRALEAQVLDVSTGLNSFIAAVNTDLGNDPVIQPFEPGAIAIQFARDHVLNSPVFIHIYVTEADSEGQGHESLKSYSVNLELSFDDEGEDNLTGYRAYRYQRALEDFMEKYWDKISDNVKSKLTSLTPISYVLPDRQTPLFGVGIQIQFDIA